jgi:uncharacterized protein YjbI with pentapeptide repeats
MVPFLYLLSLSAIAGAAVIAARHAKQDPRRRKIDTLPAVSAVGAAGLTVLVIAVQLTIQPTGELRYVLTAGVVCGGVVTAVFATWLNYRRYRVEESRQEVERDKADLERNKHQLEQEKLELEHAKDRREHAKVADESLIQAVELLGHANPRVRAGALYALAGLAAHRPDRAQEVVGLVCMYLRNVPDDGPDGVLREAQKVLHRVVAQANRAPHPVLDLDVDLTRTRLDDFALGGVTVGTLNLSGARLTGITSLRDLRQTHGDHSYQVSLDAAVFEGDVWLHGARLRRLSANKAVFHGTLSMEGSEVEREAVLSDCTIAADADLSDATFGYLNCTGSTFHGKASLRRTTVGGGGTFLQARFGRADFDQFASDHKVVFDEAHFEESLRLRPRALPLVSLRKTTIGAPTAERDRLLLPPGWRVDGGDRAQRRYLIAPGVEA